eukprot:GHVT01078682.1.p1 GENE.GHVT01078682.1~~GHVT01078682.1.p1  ORF type:complete len:559 (+),score=68.99 GHVT01078682.1:433-2109(+)
MWKKSKWRKVWRKRFVCLLSVAEPDAKLNSASAFHTYNIPQKIPAAQPSNPPVIIATFSSSLDARSLRELGQATPTEVIRVTRIKLPWVGVDKLDLRDVERDGDSNAEHAVEEPYEIPTLVIHSCERVASEAEVHTVLLSPWAVHAVRMGHCVPVYNECIKKAREESTVWTVAIQDILVGSLAHHSCCAATTPGIYRPLGFANFQPQERLLALASRLRAINHTTTTTPPLKSMHCLPVQPTGHNDTNYTHVKHNEISTFSSTSTSADAAAGHPIATATTIEDSQTDWNVTKPHVLLPPDEFADPLSSAVCPDERLGISSPAAHSSQSGTFQFCPSSRRVSYPSTSVGAPWNQRLDSTNYSGGAECRQMSREEIYSCALGCSPPVCGSASWREEETANAEPVGDAFFFSLFLPLVAASRTPGGAVQTVDGAAGCGESDGRGRGHETAREPCIFSDNEKGAILATLPSIFRRGSSNAQAAPVTSWSSSVALSSSSNLQKKTSKLEEPVSCFRGQTIDSKWPEPINAEWSTVVACSSYHNFSKAVSGTNSTRLQSQKPTNQ